MDDAAKLQPNPTRGALQLLLAIGVLVVLWCVVLPWVGTTRYVKPIIEHNQRWGIDPTALFYTDVETMTYRDHLLRRPQR
ncbi:hypothetical protein [Novipirellula caenicola]|uniref:Uncharacterized protein n=1 Tax=Novipirellula caenicola TaxID=1536901 RepID=A0ABP9VXX0_9BACT